MNVHRSLLLGIAVGCLAMGTTGFARKQTPTEVRARHLVGQLQRHGESPGEIHLALAALYSHAKQQRQVYKYIRSARRFGISEARTNIVLGEFYRRIGRYDAALTTLVRVLVHNNEQTYAMVQLWRALYESMLNGTPLKTDIDPIRLRLAAFGMRLPKNVDTSADAPTRSRKFAARGYSALLGNRTNYAAELFEAAIDASPSNARAHRGLGIARSRQRDARRAAGACLIYLELEPDAPDAEQVDQELVNYFKMRYGGTQ